MFILYLLHCGELPFQLSVYCFFSDLLTKRLSVFIPANEAACLRVSIIRKRKDTLCSAQITCNYHPPSPPFILDFSQTVATEAQHVEMHLNSYFFAHTFGLKVHKHTCLQISDLRTKRHCHAHSPNGCFVLSVIYSQNIHLPALTKASIFYHLAAQQSPNSCVLSILLIIFFAALRLHSGESSQNSKRSPARA